MTETLQIAAGIVSLLFLMLIISMILYELWKGAAK